MAVTTDAPAAADVETVTVVLYRPAMYEGKIHSSGTVLTLPAKAAASWIRNGTARISRSRLAKSAAVAAAAGGAA